MKQYALPIIDCHVHFIDGDRFRYPIFPQRSAGFEALVGDYSALPRAAICRRTIKRTHANATSGKRCGPNLCPTLRLKSCIGHNR